MSAPSAQAERQIRPLELELLLISECWKDRSRWQGSFEAFGCQVTEQAAADLPGGGVPVQPSSAGRGAGKRVAQTPAWLGPPVQHPSGVIERRHQTANLLVLAGDPPGTSLPSHLPLLRDPTSVTA